MKHLEIWQKILFGQRLSEILGQPPFEKGGRGGFLAGPWYKGKSYLLVTSLPISG
jgi:hypothetical protein